MVMKKWEYRVIDMMKEMERKRLQGLGEGDVNQKILDELGNEGWELSVINSYMYLGKREKTD